MELENFTFILNENIYFWLFIIKLQVGVSFLPKIL